MAFVFKSKIKRALSYILHGVPVYYTEAKITYTSPSQKLKGKKGNYYWRRSWTRIRHGKEIC